jgi:hypothetical protein
LRQGALDFGLRLGSFDSADKDSPSQICLDDSGDLKLGVVFNPSSLEEFVILENQVVGSHSRIGIEFECHLIICRDFFGDVDGDTLVVLLDNEVGGLIARL